MQAEWVLSYAAMTAVWEDELGPVLGGSVYYVLGVKLCVELVLYVSCNDVHYNKSYCCLSGFDLHLTDVLRKC